MEMKCIFNPCHGEPGSVRKTNACAVSWPRISPDDGMVDDNLFLDRIYSYPMTVNI
jgi:hypothetical protein